MRIDYHVYFTWNVIPSIFFVCLEKEDRVFFFALKTCTDSNEAVHTHSIGSLYEA